MQASCPSETLVSMAKATRCVTNRKTIRCSEILHFRPIPCLRVHFIYSVLISLSSCSSHDKVQRRIKKVINKRIGQGMILGNKSALSSRVYENSEGL